MTERDILDILDSVLDKLFKSRKQFADLEGTDEFLERDFALIVRFHADNILVKHGYTRQVPDDGARVLA